jgi:lambda family phage portal protein
MHNLKPVCTMANVIDRFYEFVSPSRALVRESARVKLRALAEIGQLHGQGERKYDGASRGRHYSDWYSPNLSVNQEVFAALTTLRDRARDLGRNNGYAINAIRIIANNVVGTGIIPTPTGLRKNQATKLKEVWKSWAEKTDCDYDEMNTLYGLQWLVMKTVVESGECLIRRVRGTSKDAVPLRLQLLEGDFINTSYHQGIWQADGTITYYGIKFDSRGRRLGYWLYKHAPTEFGAASEFVDAKDILHLYEIERPGQMRGVPLSCGVMLRLKDLDDYEFTERIRNKVAASFSVFVTEDSIDGGSSNRGNRPEKIEPGAIEYLPPGKKIEVAQPPTTQGFEGYVKANLRGISAGFGTTYEALTNDYSMVNFSSGRMGWLEFNRNAERYQWLMLIPRFCDKVYTWFVEAAQLAGHLPLTAIPNVTWTPPRRQMIDPHKEMEAVKTQLRTGVTSWQNVVREFGYIPDELQEELKQDKDMIDRLGLMPESDPRFDPNRVTAAPGENGDKGKDEQPPGSGDKENDKEDK